MKQDDIPYIRSKNGFIIDMDGVLYHGNKLLPGVRDFVNWLKEDGKKFVFLTNSSERTPKELKEKLNRLGIDVDTTVFYTSALATAMFLASQDSAFMTGQTLLVDGGIVLD